MTIRGPSGRLFAASSLILPRHAASRPLIVCIRQYAQKSSQPRRQQAQPKETFLPPPDAVKSALNIVEANATNDPVNPPRSTLPPTLALPTRGSETVFVYWFRIGRAYGTFYKDGVKAVWYNHKASRLIKERINKDAGAIGVSNAVARSLLSRAEFQLLARNSHDIGKLPFFGLLVLILGEWLPLFVPFMPNAVPGTCRIPKQLQQMREKAQERRRQSFRSGITEPSTDQLPENVHDGQTAEVSQAWPVAFSSAHRHAMLKNLRADQLHHLSTTLGLHSTLWDRIQLTPPGFLLRRALNERLQYLTADDFLLIQGESPSSNLTPDELRIACEERGLDVLGRKDDLLRQSLQWWLQRQREDVGQGKAMLAMLFRRLDIREWVKLNVRANERL